MRKPRRLRTGDTVGVAAAGLPIGHGKHHLTLPLGARARLDAAALDLSVLEVATA